MTDLDLSEVEGDVGLTTYDESNLNYMREQAESDFIYFAREILGYTSSLIQWDEIDPDTGEVQEQQMDKDGPKYGISRYSPHKQMADFMESGRWLHMEAPRGSYKTTVTIAWILWRIVRNPNIRVLYAMDTGKEAKKKLRAMMHHLSRKDALILKLWPGMAIMDRTGESFTICGRTKSGIVDPSVEAVGVESDFTGSHRDIICMDDAVNFQNIRTDTGIEKVRDFFDHLIPLLDPGGVMLVIGTRYADADLYGDVLRDMLIEVGGVWKALVLGCGMELYRNKEGLWDLRGKAIFNHQPYEVLISILRTMSGMTHSKFACQYLNSILAADEQIFHRFQFQTETWAESGSWLPKCRWHILTDTATSEERDACFTVIALLGIDGTDNAYLADLRVGRWNPMVVIETILEVFETWTAKGINATQICMEKVSLNKTYRAWLETLMRQRQLKVPVTETSRGAASGSKDQRIEGLGGRFQNKRFYVMDSVPHLYDDGIHKKVLWDPQGFRDEKTHVALPGGELVDQFVRFPKGRFKDIPDCIADLDHYEKGQRVCKGSGHRDEIRDILSGRAGQATQVAAVNAALRRRSGRGSKWDSLAQRCQERR